MKKNFAIAYCLLLLLLGHQTTKAQVSMGGQPLALKETHYAKRIPVVQMPTLNMEAIQAEDAAEEGKDIPPRFGYPIDVQLDLNNSGIWIDLPNGARLWQLQIESEGALTLNLNYGKFFMPAGAKFFIYNPDTKETLGAFTSYNNKSHGTFATGFTKGNRAVLEYYEPATQKGKGIISISQVIHGYKSIISMVKAFGSSGSCNNNVVCALSAGWENQIKGVAMLLTSGNSRFCSGSLINTTAQNCKPYFLTADHCVGETAGQTANYIFMFNYNSPTCSPSADGPTNQTVQGATLRAVAGASDFALFELDDNPADFYDVYFNGWSNSSTPSPSAVGIHHPAGDVKKFSVENDPLSATAYSGGAGNNHWQVADWDSGTTEGGSSGSPLFNNSQQIVGQLHGGGAACGNNLQDYYGSLWYSWDQNGTVSTVQLKPWLDPINSGATAIDGTYDICAPPAADDAGISSIIEPTAQVCSATITPQITLTNYGSNTLTAVTINYSLNGSNYTYNWTGSLATNTSATLSLPSLSTPAGTHTFTASTSNPNGTTDPNTGNDMSSIIFSSTGGTVCYCTSQGNSVADEWIQSVQIGAFSNNSGNNGGYEDFTVQTVSLAVGSNSLVLTPGFTSTVYNEYWRIWIDLNQDGDFDDAGELTFDAGAVSNTTVTGTMVLNTAISGTTRMRVSMKYNTAPTPCEAFDYGEVEDYTVIIGDCTAPDTDGDGICDTADLCPGFDDNADADGDGIPDGCDTCNACPCASQGNSTADEWIESVQIGSLTNVSGNNQGYADFSTLDTLDIETGTTYAFTLTPGFTGPLYNEYWKIWIDYNQNGSFEDSGELVYDAGSAVNTAVSESFAVPAGTTNGYTWLRVSMKYNAASTSCETFTWGEVEDYIVHIITPTACQDIVSISGTFENGSNTLYEANIEISATQTIQSGATQELRAGNSVLLIPQFVAESGSDVWVHIEGCTPPAILKPESDETTQSILEQFNKVQNTDILPKLQPLQIQMQPNPADDFTQLSFSAPHDTQILVEIYDMQAMNVVRLHYDNITAQQSYNLQINTNDLPSGMYLVKVSDMRGTQQTLKLVVQ